MQLYCNKQIYPTIDHFQDIGAIRKVICIFLKKVIPTKILISTLYRHICEGSHAHYHATHAIVAAKSFDLCHPDGHHGDSKSRNYMETILRDSHQLYFAHILSNAW